MMRIVIIMILVMMGKIMMMDMMGKVMMTNDDNSDEKDLCKQH